MNNPNPIVQIDLPKIEANDILDVSTTEKTMLHLTRHFSVKAAAFH